MPISEELEHILMVERAARKTRKDAMKHGKRRAKYKARRERTKIAKELDKLPTRELRSSLARRARKAFMERTTPEERSAIAQRAAVTRALRAKYCDHSKLPPKKREHGKNAGKFVCLSCNKVVPAPEQKQEVVT